MQKTKKPQKMKLKTLVIIFITAMLILLVDAIYGFGKAFTCWINNRPAIEHRVARLETVQTNIITSLSELATKHNVVVTHIRAEAAIKAAKIKDEADKNAKKKKGFFAW